jgi:hypothetical protein
MKQPLFFLTGGVTVWCLSAARILDSSEAGVWRFTTWHNELDAPRRTLAEARIRRQFQEKP